MSRVTCSHSHECRVIKVQIFRVYIHQGVKLANILCRGEHFYLR
jgi:hypothetical protein